MSLLREIQDAAIDGSSDLETLLRKCRVLATRLNHEELKNWVNWELDGYPSRDKVPDYRKMDGSCYGQFFGYAGRSINNVPIAATAIHEDIRDDLTRYDFLGGVGSLASMIESVEDSVLKFSWPAEAAYFVRPTNLAPDFALAQGWIVIGKGAVVGILSTVRNKILSFALEIGASYPDAGEAKPGGSQVPKEVVTQIFQQTFNGPVGNVASGNGTIEQVGVVNIQPGDFQQLASILREKGISEKDIRDLEKAIGSDERPAPSSSAFGQKVSSWVGTMIGKAAQGVWKVGVEAGSKLLIEAIKAHYGMHL